MPRMRPGRIRHDIADQTIPDPFSWRMRTRPTGIGRVRTIVDTIRTGYANAAYRPLPPPVRLP